MPSDKSRRTDDGSDGYVGVVAQQGRVTVDRDFNDEHGYLAGRIEADAVEEIGPCGTPDDGFRISLVPASPPAPASPPGGRPFDFAIAPGSMYVGGQRAVFPIRPADQTATYSYYDQPDRLASGPWEPPAAPRRGGSELVYLMLAEQEVSAIEDPELLEVALGGPDTTQRLRPIRRVERMAVDAADCASGWGAALAALRAADGLVLDPATMRLGSTTRLQVGFADDDAVVDPCDPTAYDGYLGAENQAIRVQIATAGGPGEPATLLWGYDNASFLYRAVAAGADGTLLTIAPSPPDAAHIPQAGQVVEVLRTAVLLGSAPDATDPAAKAEVVRCIAEARGVARRLAQPYGTVAADDPAVYIVLDQPLPPEYLAETTPLFLRVWQSEIAFDPAGDTVLLTDDVTGASTGVTVTLSVPAGDVPTPGAFWLLAVRPSTPQAVYPQRLLVAPQPPDGPRLWACPLATIDWSDRAAPIVTDCRERFDTLVELTRRGNGCCTIAVSPGGTLGVQEALDRAARAGGGTVCLRPGTHLLDEPLHLGARHAGLVLEACGDGALAAAAGREAAFGEGLIVIAGASGVTLRGLTLHPAVAPWSGAMRERLVAAGRAGGSAAATAQGGAIGVTIGIHVAESRDVAVIDCTVEFGVRALYPVRSLVGAGLFLRGSCDGLRVTGSTVRSRIVPTFRPVPENGLAAAPQAVTTAPATMAPVATAPAMGASPEASAPVTTAAPAAPEPGPLAARLAELSRVALGALAANDAETEAAVARTMLVAIVGCLAMPTLAAGDDQPAIECDLGTAVLRDNRFIDLTLAFHAMAGARTLRLQDNDADDCLGGFWMLFTHWQPPRDPKAASLFDHVWRRVERVYEILLLTTFGLAMPLPAGAEDGGRMRKSAGPASLLVLGNQVEPTARANAGTAALVVLANRAPLDGVDTGASLVVANNRLRTRSPNGAPTALIATQELQRCAIGTNLILSEGAREIAGASLLLVPDVISPQVQLLSVAGNVLQGQSDLGLLARDGGAPPQTWVPYNAMPS